MCSISVPNRQIRRRNLAIMVICMAGRPRPSPLVGGNRETAIGYGPADRWEHSPLGVRGSGWPCHLGDRPHTLRPAHLHRGGGIPQVITCRRQPSPGVAGHDHPAAPVDRMMVPG